MRIVVLTSSRADYGIYKPLLKRLEADEFFSLKLIVFGTHLSNYHGLTINQIKKDGFEIVEEVETLLLHDSEAAISTSMGVTATKFAAVWKRLKPKIDLIICLGDRYEMFAAVAATVPFNLSIAHFHGGETTLGAIDNTFRHSITLMSSYHFTATQTFADKVEMLTGSTKNIFNVGALSMDNLHDMSLLSKEDFLEKHRIDMFLPTILCTLHPETVAVEKNRYFVKELASSFKELTNYQIVITMPNADTAGTIIREELLLLIKQTNHVIGVENFGTLGYFSCIKHCAFLLGNTSSGIIEAASLGKYVINIGNRQQGRATSSNIIHVPIQKEAILEAVKGIQSKGDFTGENIYCKKNQLAVEQTINILRDLSI